MHGKLMGGFAFQCAMIDLDDNERQLYTQLYPHEVATMSGFAQRFLEKGREEGM
ncbi:MAG: hypothetical protein NHG36_13490 [Chromatiaceae bacterium]|nr:hypothetical protein [Candidatus Thioaporhodococcus sediminis]